MKGFRRENNTLIWERNHETMLIEPWGKDSLRVRSTKSPELMDSQWALLSPVDMESAIEIDEGSAIIQNDKIKAEISRYGRIRFLRSVDNTVLLEEPDIPYGAGRHPARYHKPVSSDLFRLEQTFSACEGERFY
jgi:alpha-D-xyloside xylohydrolase